MRIYCIARYRSATLRTAPGDTVDVADAEARRLLADAPGCWSLNAPMSLAEVEPVADADCQQYIAEAAQKAIDTPPHDKMIRHRRIK